MPRDVTAVIERPPNYRILALISTHIFTNRFLPSIDWSKPTVSSSPHAVQVSLFLVKQVFRLLNTEPPQHVICRKYMFLLGTLDTTSKRTERKGCFNRSEKQFWMKKGITS